MASAPWAPDPYVTIDHERKPHPGGTLVALGWNIDRYACGTVICRYRVFEDRLAEQDRLDVRF
jgi:hypothetical protein